MERIDTIAIYGGGGHGKVVADIAASNGFGSILWIDDAPKEEAVGLEEFIASTPDIPVALGIGNNLHREKSFQRLTDAGLKVISLVHPSAIISESAVIERGAVVMPGAVINAEAVVKEGAIINSAAVIEHDCVIGRFAHISPNCALGGDVKVGERTHIGIGASVIQCLSIGPDVKVGAGAAVIHNLPGSIMAAGVPAVIKKEFR
ncbi:MAG: acetyltransferase [Helicobacteraceae bacterium 4484_230]|nr:MAG: acetyltransferase [Helicobacteraceae bacterium 4484_230]